MYDVKLFDCSDESYSFTVAEIANICAPLFRPCVPNVNLRAFSSLQLADDYRNSRHLTVDILVRVDAYWKSMVPNNVVQADGLVAHESVFGWVLSGSCIVPARRENVSSQLLCIYNIPESALHNFWNLESVGVCNCTVAVS